MFYLRQLKLDFPDFTKDFLHYKKDCYVCGERKLAWEMVKNSDRGAWNDPCKIINKCRACNSNRVKKARFESKDKRHISRWDEIIRAYSIYFPEPGFNPLDNRLFLNWTDTPQTPTYVMIKGRYYNVPFPLIHYFRLWPTNAIHYALASWQYLINVRCDKTWNNHQINIANSITPEVINILLSKSRRNRKNYLRKLKCNKCNKWKFTSIESTNPILCLYTASYLGGLSPACHPYEFYKQKSTTRVGWYKTCNKCRGFDVDPINILIDRYYPLSHKAWGMNRDALDKPLFYKDLKYFPVEEFREVSNDVPKSAKTRTPSDIIDPTTQAITLESTGDTAPIVEEMPAAWQWMVDDDK